jgi:hypothetical protein
MITVGQRVARFRPNDRMKLGEGHIMAIIRYEDFSDDYTIEWDDDFVESITSTHFTSAPPDRVEYRYLPSRHQLS